MSASALPPWGFSPGAIGPVVGADGSPARERMTKDGALVTVDGHGRYTEANYRGNVFYGTNTAAQALSVASSTYTGLIIQNPVNNTKNFAVLEVSWATSIAPTGVGSVVLGWGTAQTAGVPLALTTGNSSGGTGVSAFLGTSVRSTAQVGASCTFSVNGAAAAPTILRPLFGVPWVTAVGNSNAHCHYDFGGTIVIAPGYNLCIEAITTALTGFGYISWEEIPL